MKTISAEILKPCTVTCLPGSVVEITEQQFRALGDKARYLPDDVDAPETVDSVPEPEVPETVENPVESVENTPEAAEIPEKKSGRVKRKKD
ncbi:MAG: hypothetical protein IJR72_03790 [Oscillospiraceae bacterium]|nr:hypothetical protein [Oscillospiraceae bacterium]